MPVYALLDLALLFILIGGGYLGYRRGLFRLAVTPFRVIICLAVAYLLCGEVGEELISPLLVPAMRGYLSELLKEQISSDGSIHSLPTLLKIFIGLSALGGTEVGELTLEGILDRLILPLSALVSRMIAFALLFILATLMLKILIHLVDRLLDRGLLGKLNSVLGVLLSGCISLALAICLSAVIDYLVHLDPDLAGEFVGGPLFRLFREVSPIRLLLSF